MKIENELGSGILMDAQMIEVSGDLRIDKRTAEEVIELLGMYVGKSAVIQCYPEPQITWLFDAHEHREHQKEKRREEYLKLKEEFE